MGVYHAQNRNQFSLDMRLVGGDHGISVFANCKNINGTGEIATLVCLTILIKNDFFTKNRVKTALRVGSRFLVNSLRVKTAYDPEGSF